MTPKSTNCIVSNRSLHKSVSKWTFNYNTKIYGIGAINQRLLLHLQSNLTFEQLFIKDMSFLLHMFGVSTICSPYVMAMTPQKQLPTSQQRVSIIVIYLTYRHPNVHLIMINGAQINL